MIHLFHESNGTMGGKMMHQALINMGHVYSVATIWKYRKEMQMKSCIRRKRASYTKGDVHHLFPNIIQQQFEVKEANKVWCIDFTYLKLNTGKNRYNCSVIDLHRRRIVSSVNGDNINSKLAIQAVSKAILQHHPNAGLILHSDQGSQFASREFIMYCQEHQIQQSMSRAGCPYDNAVMERYFNTLKYECVYQYEFHTKEKMDEIIHTFAFEYYNKKRPHTYNNGLPPIIPLAKLDTIVATSLD